MNMPSVDEVRIHETERPVIDRRGIANGGLWVIFDPEGSIAPRPEFARLSVRDDVIMIQNGWSFWQPLHECRWAARSEYRPVDPKGWPI